MQTVTIDIDGEGTVKIETKGFAGSSCKDATRDVERALGVVTETKPTAEMYQRATATQGATNGKR